MKSPNHETIDAWIALMSASRQILEQVESALSKAKLPPLTWYDALLEIERSGSDGIRPFELKDRLLLPQYGTSRLLDRITKAGLIEKVCCKEDGRGFLVRITPKGRRVRRRMWPIYGETLRLHIESHSTIQELNTLSRICRQISSSTYGVSIHRA